MTTTIPTSKAFLRAFGAVAKKATQAYRKDLDVVLFSGAEVVATDSRHILQAIFPKPLTKEPVVFSGASIRSAAVIASNKAQDSFLDIAKSEVQTSKGASIVLDRVDMTYPSYHYAIPSINQGLFEGMGRFDPALLGELLTSIGAIGRSLSSDQPACEVRMLSDMQARLDQQFDVEGIGSVQLTAVIMGLRE